MKNKFYFFCLLLIICWLSYSNNLLACPGCSEIIKFGKDAVGAMRFGKGIAWSMALLFAVPFLLVGGMTAVVIHLERKRPK